MRKNSSMYFTSVHCIFARVCVFVFLFRLFVLILAIHQVKFIYNICMYVQTHICHSIYGMYLFILHTDHVAPFGFCLIPLLYQRIRPMRANCTRSGPRPNEFIQFHFQYVGRDYESIHRWDLAGTNKKHRSPFNSLKCFQGYREQVVT